MPTQRKTKKAKVKKKVVAKKKSQIKAKKVVKAPEPVMPVKPVAKVHPFAHFMKARFNKQASSAPMQKLSNHETYRKKAV